MEKKRTRVTLIIFIAVLSIVLCLLMSMCLLLENRECGINEKKPALIPIEDKEAENTVGTEFPGVTEPLVEEGKETEVTDRNSSETAGLDKETDRDYQHDGEYETDRDYNNDEEYEIENDSTICSESETSGDNDHNVDRDNKPGSSNETDRDSETDRDNETERA